MATYGNETVDNYLYSSYNPYYYKYPKFKGWRQKAYFTNYGEGETYFDNYHRAQLKSILSQINPNLTPRLRKANTKDVGVQVNPKTDASIQCSLGPRTLLARKRDALRRRRQEVQTPGSPINSGGGVRFPRTQAVYSPVESRRLVSLFREEGEEEEDTEPEDTEPVDRAEKLESTEKDERKQGEKSVKEPLSPEKNRTKQTETNENTNEPVKTEQDDPKSKARVRFQVT